ncbi:hypothetical protein P43SY_005264 [Pythium insidiosum]|uniref:Uncharacterized protein n=1 Tax=Pythium insidiosum TaxID=114742 RepID=A0AAD5Q815_PYTIN|nr:hypothetical protein P43SY_005264 [Pythium insidiosum]
MNTLFRRTSAPAMERDVDMEIEERRRGGFRSADAQRIQNLRATAQQPRESGRAATLSQRMLRALHDSRSNVRSGRRGSVLLDVVADDAPQPQRHASRNSIEADMDGFVVPDPLYDPTQDPVYMSDDESAVKPAASLSVTSCTDRLEARISNRSLSSRQGSFAAHTEGHESNTVYAGRRTYPAETARAQDPRLSDPAGRRPSPSVSAHEQQRSSAEMILMSHAVSTRPATTPDVAVNLKANQALPISFHFRGQRQPQQATTPPQTNQHVQLAKSLADIEQVIDGLEACVMATSFSSLAPVALRELELLRGTTKQIRTSATSLILAEMRRPNSEAATALRRLTDVLSEGMRAIVIVQVTSCGVIVR